MRASQKPSALANPSTSGSEVRAVEALNFRNHQDISFDPMRPEWSLRAQKQELRHGSKCTKCGW